MTAAATSDRPPPQRVLVLGIGNVLWADEGFGVRAVEALHERYAFAPHVELVDGGTQGLMLLAPVGDADAVLVFDACDFGDPPGTLRLLRDRDVPAWSGTRMSLHQQSFMDLLAVADLQDRFPPRLTLVGVQPALLSDFGGSLSPPVRARLDDALAAAVEQLAAWGCPAQTRAAAPAERLNDRALERDRYEGDRPDAAAACRIGDARFLTLRAAAAAAVAER